MVQVESVVDELAPKEAYQALAEAPDAVMIDVRTEQEWSMIGLPDVSEIGKPLWTVEWVSYPDFRPNQAFMDQLEDNCGGTLPTRMFFICKSGARSMAAAHHVAAICHANGQSVHCTNVAEGLEGDVNAGRSGGNRPGWIRRGLPWRRD